VDERGLGLPFGHLAEPVVKRAAGVAVNGYNGTIVRAPSPIFLLHGLVLIRGGAGWQALKNGAESFPVAVAPIGGE